MPCCLTFFNAQTHSLFESNEEKEGIDIIDNYTVLFSDQLMWVIESIIKIIPKFHHRIRVWRETKAGIRWRRLLSCPEISPSGESFENLCGGSLWECRSWPPAWMAALSEDAARVKIVYWWWEKARPSRYFYVDGSEEEVTFSYFYSDYGWQIGCFSSSGWGITYWVCCSFIENGAPCLNAGNLNPQF